MSDFGRLSSRQAAAITALLSAGTLTEAARLARVSPRTLRRWLQQPSFAQAYREARRELLSLAVGRLENELSRAIRTIGELLGDPDVSASVRLSAARAIVEYGLRAAVYDDVDERLRQLEERLELR